MDSLPLNFHLFLRNFGVSILMSMAKILSSLLSCNITWIPNERYGTQDGPAALGPSQYKYTVSLDMDSRYKDEMVLRSFL